MELLNMLPPEMLLGGGVVIPVFFVFLLLYFTKRKKSAVKKGPSLAEQQFEELKKEVVARPQKSFKSLEEALSQTKKSFWGRISGSLTGDSLDKGNLEDIEEILYTSDLGPKTVQRLFSSMESKIKPGMTGEELRQVLRSEMIHIFAETKQESDSFLIKPDELTVWMVVGVNGAGKTTTIGKLASQLQHQGKKVLIAAGDTFRAAADEQLKVWSERANVEIFSPDNVKDPSAVAFDAVNKAKAKGFDVVIIDTAGRLHTQKNLMEELKKVKRVMEKVVPTAPHEVILVLDANSGQNALVQAEQFHQALGVTGVILTKMDGSAKGGVAVGIACDVGLPVRMIGVGESVEDLRVFSPQSFVDSII
jgi:fused signal recognition particle receptor